MNQWQGKKWYCYGTSMTDNVSLTKTTGMNCKVFLGKLKNIYPNE